MRYTYTIELKSKSSGSKVCKLSNTPGTGTWTLDTTQLWRCESVLIPALITSLLTLALKFMQYYICPISFYFVLFYFILLLLVVALDSLQYFTLFYELWKHDLASEVGQPHSKHEPAFQMPWMNYLFPLLTWKKGWTESVRVSSGEYSQTWRWPLSFSWRQCSIERTQQCLSLKRLIFYTHYERKEKCICIMELKLYYMFGRVQNPG